MKKTWVAPMIETIDISSTAHGAIEGIVVDGIYLDDATCDYKNSYNELS